MSAYIPKLLTNTELLSLPAYRYEGSVRGVEPSQVFNPYKRKKEDVPVLVFEDGWSWILNVTARRELMKAWGADTDQWIGRRLAIYLKSVARKDKLSGRLQEGFEKHVEPL